MLANSPWKSFQTMVNPNTQSVKEEEIIQLSNQTGPDRVENLSSI